MALVAAILPNVPGFLGTVGAIDKVEIPFWMSLYSYAWFIGFAVAVRQVPC